MNKSMQRSSPWKQTSVIVVVAISMLALVSFFMFPSSTAPSVLGSGTGIVHIVMFEYKEDAKAAEVTDVNAKMLALKDNCVHPRTRKPYVRMGAGGKQNSPEGLTVGALLPPSPYESHHVSEQVVRNYVDENSQGGVQYIFVMEFANEEDRAYYLDKDPVHVAFKSSIGGVIKKVQVVDFVPGVF
ncbi:stress responsive A/B barrel domain protein [Diplocarpon mali]|nr:stress responsive A/B barrel domain protein [Diplocarpon mali]